MQSMAAAHNKMMGFGMSYGGLEEEWKSPEEEKKEKEEEEAAEVFEFYEEDEVEYGSEDEEECAFLSAA